MAAAVLRPEPPPGPLPAPAGGPAESETGHEGGLGPPREPEGAGEPLLEPGAGGPVCAGSAPRAGPPSPGRDPRAAEEAEPEPEPECPVCTEPYDGGAGPHPRALLNCGHALCGRCLRTLLAAGPESDIGRVRCPLCRQRTPVLEWEIRRLQEELLLLPERPAPAPAPALPPRRPGLCGALEHHFQVRFHTGRVFGCLPCVRYPPGLLGRLAGLERRCRGCYLLALAALLLAETLSLLLVFLPVLLLVLLFLILQK